MNKAEFNLSKKIFPDGVAIGVESVKEFIKIEEDLLLQWQTGKISTQEFWNVREKLVGDKLI